MKWMIVKVGDGLFKLFRTQSGGYLDGDSWYLNSGIKSIKCDDKFYIFNGYSGSSYTCHIDNYGIACILGYSVLEDMKSRYPDLIAYEEFPIDELKDLMEK